MGDMPTRELEQPLDTPACAGQGGWLEEELTQAAATEHLPGQNGKPEPKAMLGFNRKATVRVKMGKEDDENDQIWPLLP